MSDELFKAGIKLLIILIAILAATYAWFMNSETATINSLTQSTRPVNNIKVSLDGGVTWEDIGDLNLRSNFTFDKEITSNGIELYRAKTKTTAGIPTAFVAATKDIDYLEFQVMLKADLKTAIFLDSSSYVIPAVGTTTESLIGPTVTRLSPLGNFSKDLIAGAVRVAVIENDYIAEEYVPQSSTKLVWAPNKEYEIAYNAGTYSAYINSNNDQNYNYLEVTSETVFNESRVLNLKDNLNATNETKHAGGDLMLTYIPCNTENELDHIRTLTVRVWVEGNDRETSLATKGGLFKIKLVFVGIDKLFDTVPPAISANSLDNTITGFASGMEYSQDYGNNWINYINNSNPTFESGDTVYVRKAETSTTFASDYEILSF